MSNSTIPTYDEVTSQPVAERVERDSVDPSLSIDLSVVVPCYRASASLEELTEGVRAAAQRAGLSLEIILVNDASPDDTWPVITDLAERHHDIVGIDLLSNHGQPIATMCGLEAARGKLIATMDDDLEHPPDQLDVLVDAIRSNPELDAVVATWPISRSMWRDLGTRIHATADRIAWGTPRGFRHTAFRVMRRPTCDALVAHGTRSPVVGTMLHRVASNVINVEITPGVRREGSSGFSVRQGTRIVVQNFISGSTAPLKLISTCGLALATVAFTVGAVLFGRWALGASSPSGWLSVMITTIALGGANLFAFGVVGTYLESIVREVRQTPRWSVRRTVAWPDAGTTERCDNASGTTSSAQSIGSDRV